MFKHEIEIHEPIIFVFLELWEPIISYNFLLWQALHGSETSFPIIEPIMSPLRTHNFFTMGTHKKSSNFYGDVTLVNRKKI
jgi:hypothetical protein